MSASAPARARVCGGNLPALIRAPQVRKGGYRLWRAPQPPRNLQGAISLRTLDTLATKFYGVQTPRLTPHRAAWFEDPVLQQQLDTLTRSYARPGNAVSLLVDGEASFSQKRRAIARADVVLVKSYLWHDDSTGRDIARLLAEAAARGAQVCVQYGLKTAYGPATMALAKLGLRSTVPPVLRTLAQCPRVTLMANDFPHKWRDLLLRRDHEKYLITYRHGDHAELFAGGMNITNSWEFGGNPSAQSDTGVKYRDTDVRVTGPVVADAVAAFCADARRLDANKAGNVESACAHWCNGGKEISRADSTVRFISTSPRDKNGGQTIESLYVKLLEHVPAGESVHLENAYVLPSRKIKQALLCATGRGVKVDLVINSSSSPELEARTLSVGGRSFLRALLRQTRHPDNFKFYEFRGSGASGHNSLHQKIASFGTGGPYLVGSSNLDAQSLYWNKEDALLMYDSSGRNAFDTLWRRDVDNLLPRAGGLPIVTTYALTPTVLWQDSWLNKLYGWLLMHLLRKFL